MIKIKRKLHNKMFKSNKLNLFQYSVVNEDLELDCYVSKWFLTLIFIPILFIGTLVEGFPSAFKNISRLFKNPYYTESLTKDELHKLISK